MLLEKVPFYPIEITDRKRILLLIVLLVVLYALLLVQFYRIQIVEGSNWDRYAHLQHYQTISEPFRRGTFWSNTSLKVGHPDKPQAFAIDLPKFHLYADPLSIPSSKRKEISTQLWGLLNFSTLDEQWIEEQLGRRSRSRKIALWLDQDKRDQIRNWWQPYAKRNKIASNALFFINDYQRSYPFNKLLGQVLHTIQEQKDEVTKQGVPTGGLEMYFNEYLKGKQGKRQISRSLRHPLGMGQVIEPPENGSDIYLTINHYLQAIIEEELALGVRKARAKGGWAVMMDPYTGEILALAQYPFFSPAEYQYYFNHPELMDYTRVKAVMDSYEPGSVVKPLTLAICLKANSERQKKGLSPIFSPDEKVDTSTGFFPGRRKPITDTHMHPYLNMNLALQKSSNIYMAKMIDRVIQTFGAQWYRDVLHNCFGFGTKTGIELPAESIGLLPQIGKTYPNGLMQWSTPTPYSLAMGYNMQVNSIQMLRAYALLANGGYLVDPTLIRKIIKTDAWGQQHTLLDNTLPERRAAFPQVIDGSIMQNVVKAMKFVTKRGGSAPRADIPGYTEAGKTSTSHKAVSGSYTDTYFSTFIGMVPAFRPRFMLLIGIDEPERLFIPGVGFNHRGGNCAAPLFSQMARRCLEYLGISPDDPYGYPKGDPRYDAKKADWEEQVQQLQELYQAWNGKK